MSLGQGIPQIVTLVFALLGAAAALKIAFHSVEALIVGSMFLFAIAYNRGLAWKIIYWVSWVLLLPVMAATAVFVGLFWQDLISEPFDLAEPENPEEPTLQQALINHGWSLKFFRWDLRAARIGKRNKVSGWEPFRRLTRMLNTDAFLPIEQVIPRGSLVKFSADLATDRSFVGLFEPRHVVPGELPYEKFLTVTTFDGIFFNVVSEESSSGWRVFISALTYLREIKVKSGSQ